jgi:DNA end-binding protein Ku
VLNGLNAINGSTSRFDLGDCNDDYEAAVKNLVDAKRKGKPLSTEEPEVPRPKVVNIMDALRSSLAESKKPKHTTAKRAQRKRKSA